jgi:hypothetical protein
MLWEGFDSNIPSRQGTIEPTEVSQRETFRGMRANDD